MRPDFSDIQINEEKQQESTARSNERVSDKHGVKHTKRHFSKEDIFDYKHLRFAAGITPFTRGIYSAMYTTNPLIVNRQPCFSTVEKLNLFYRENFILEQKNIVINLATRKGYNSNNAKVIAGVECVVIDSLLDMEALFYKIPLDKVSLFVEENIVTLPIVSFYIDIAKKRNIHLSKLRITIIHDVSNNLSIRNSSTLKASNTIKPMSDIFGYTSSKEMLKFNVAFIMGACNMSKGKISAEIELAYTFVRGLEYIRAGLKSGFKIDELSTRISVFFDIGENHFIEVAKMRAARMIWAKIINKFNPKNHDSMALHIHTKTPKSNVPKREFYSNITQTCLDVITTVLGGAQSIQINDLDEVATSTINLPESIAHNTQKHIQEEAKITKGVDPWAGSYYIEYLTQEISKKTWQYIGDIEKCGGVEKALKLNIHHISNSYTDDTLAKKNI